MYRETRTIEVHRSRGFTTFGRWRTVIPLLPAIVRSCSERFALNTPKYSVKAEQIAHISGKRHLLLAHTRSNRRKKGLSCAFTQKVYILSLSHGETHRNALSKREKGCFCTVFGFWFAMRFQSVLFLVCSPLRVSGSGTCFVFGVLRISVLQYVLFLVCEAFCTAVCLWCTYNALCFHSAIGDAVCFSLYILVWDVLLLYVMYGVWWDMFLVCGVLGFPYTCRLCGMRQVFFMR